MRTVFLTLLVIALASPAPAAVYRCRDKKGVLILTDDPDHFPKGCRPEGTQGVTSVPPGNAESGKGTPSPSVAPQGQPSSGERDATRDRRSERRPPAEKPEELPAGSSGVPPDLNRPDRFGTPPATGGRQAPPQAAPGVSPQGEGGPGFSVGPQLEGWLEEARALNREYLESRTGPTPSGGSPDPRQEIERRIDAFLTRLDNSPLSSQERTAVEKELPPSP